MLLKQQHDIETMPYVQSDGGDLHYGGCDNSDSAARGLNSGVGPAPCETNCNLPQAWPNPACKAWTPSPEYYHRPLYTAPQRAIRDKTVWTMVQAILAPLQFLIFAISLGLVARFLTTGQGYEIATASVVAKTIILYVIMITGSIWEKVVFDEWLFVESFFWEDVFSMLVLGLQTLYLGALIFGW